MLDFFTSVDHNGELFSINAQGLSHVELIPPKKRTKTSEAETYRMQFWKEDEVLYTVRGKRANKCFTEWLNWVKQRMDRPDFIAKSTALNSIVPTHR